MQILLSFDNIVSRLSDLLYLIDLIIIVYLIVGFLMLALRCLDIGLQEIELVFFGRKEKGIRTIPYNYGIFLNIEISERE